MSRLTNVRIRFVLDRVKAIVMNLPTTFFYLKTHEIALAVAEADIAIRIDTLIKILSNPLSFLDFY